MESEVISTSTISAQVTRLVPSRLGYHKTVIRVEFLRDIDSKSDFEALLSIADLLDTFVKTTCPLLIRTGVCAESGNRSK